MCGIAGVLTTLSFSGELIQHMTRQLAHRGPDNEGIWVDREAGICLGHRRLSIIDLSPAGNEPMHSADGRYVITFNGEIYNHAELRRELERAAAVPIDGWVGHSDIEVFLQGVTTWGLTVTLQKSAGMFAFALWDRRERTLSLVRDRFGEKPLYYGWVGRDFLFGSELKALRAHPRFDNPIDRRALRRFAERSYIPTPLSIYERIYKLPPGCALTVTAEGICKPLRIPPEENRRQNGLWLQRYWSYRDVVERGLQEPIIDEEAAVEGLERTLATAIRGQSMADVPVGAFLSGGIDSSTIVALYQKYSSIPVRTFSIGFEEQGFNEAEYAKAVAKHLGTVHNEHYVTVREARDVIALLPSMYDEPFADSSQIPTHLVSQFARGQVTVALTGDGGDELFAGYSRHFEAPRLWAQLRKLPKPLRKTGLLLNRVPSQFWNGVGNLLPGRRQPQFGAKLQKAFRVAASAGSLNEVYWNMLDEWDHETSPVLGGDEQRATMDIDFGNAPAVVRMLYFDAVTYLPDDILCKVDRASMAVGLETRVPFLDHRVAEMAARIPLAMKIRGGRGKHIVRRLLNQQVPPELVERPKTGFAIPVGEWVRGPLRPWAEDLLEPRAMRAQGWLNPQIVQRRWRDHVTGTRDSSDALWAVLMFQAWLGAQ